MDIICLVQFRSVVLYPLGHGLTFDLPGGARSSLFQLLEQCFTSCLKTHASHHHDTVTMMVGVYSLIIGSSSSVATSTVVILMERTAVVDVEWMQPLSTFRHTYNYFALILFKLHKIW